MTFSKCVKFYEAWAPVLARVVVGSVFLFAAWGKVPLTTMFSQSVAYAASAGLPFPTLAVGLAFVLEVCAGLALVLGWRARIAAAALIPYVIILTLVFHLRFSSPIDIGFFVDHLVLISTLILLSIYGAQHMAIRKDSLPY